MGDFKLDMTMMLAFHDALRRDLTKVVRTDGRSEGWEFFERMLHLHHTAEDDLLWPVVRTEVAGRSEDLALLDEMVAEHAAIAPLLDSLNRALEENERAPQIRSDLDARVREHLAHEESQALPLIDRVLTPEQWMTFGMGANERVGSDMPRFLPWLLEGADDDMTRRVLGFIPPHAQQTYQDEWRPAYAARDYWATKKMVS